MGAPLKNPSCIEDVPDKVRAQVQGVQAQVQGVQAQVHGAQAQVQGV